MIGYSVFEVNMLHYPSCIMKGVVSEPLNTLLLLFVYFEGSDWAMVLLGIIVHDTLSLIVSL